MCKYVHEYFFTYIHMDVSTFIIVYSNRYTYILVL